MSIKSLAEIKQQKMGTMVNSLVTVCLLICTVSGVRYEPNWASIDSRPLPGWYDDAKFGIFIHWGVFSVPSVGYGTGGSTGEWFWWNWQGLHIPAYVDFMKKNYPPGFSYEDFAPSFKAEFFDPDEWAALLESSGAKYVVFTSKHVEGFTNWPSEVAWNWNSVDTGPHRDIVGDLAGSIRSKTSMHFGLYHCLYEWFNPWYVNDKKNNWTTNDFVRLKTGPELYEIVNAYKPELIFSDGDWEAPDTYWNSTNFLAWLYNDRTMEFLLFYDNSISSCMFNDWFVNFYVSFLTPIKDTVVVNDRWGINSACTHGGYYDCHDRFNPGTLHTHKWENAMTIDRYSWGYRRNAILSDYLTIEELVATLAMTVSNGGNMLMNVGPAADGLIGPIFQERLRQMGQWLAVNGDAIYKTKPWSFQNDTVTPNVWYTASKSSQSVNAIVLNWPEGDDLYLDAPQSTSSTTVTLMGYNGTFSWTEGNPTGLHIHIPPISINEMPCQWAWVFVLQGLAE